MRPESVIDIAGIRTDCARDGLSPDLLREAARQALRRGLVGRDELGDVEAALAPFGGLAA